MFVALVFFLCGIGLVLLGADKLTDGAVGWALRWRMGEWFVGLTIVALGTSLPELAIGLTASIKGCESLTLGNVVGSNVFNVLTIIGCSAIVHPILISKSTVAKDIPFALLATVVLAVMSLDAWMDSAAQNWLTRTEGLLLLGYFVVFMCYTYAAACRREKTICGGIADERVVMSEMPYWKIVLFTSVGIVCLISGAILCVDSIRTLAMKWNVSETWMGLTLLAVGTSLPELVTSIVAARKGCSAIAIGNVVGNSIFNVFLVLGVCATLSPIPADDLSITTWGLMLLSILVFWFFAYTKRIIERWEGGIMLLLYGICLAYWTFHT